MQRLNLAVAALMAAMHMAAQTPTVDGPLLLDEGHLLLDGSLTDDEVSGHPYIYNKDIGR